MPPRNTGTRPPLVAHVIEYLGAGGLENGVVNLVNHMPASSYRHAIVCLKGYSSFRHRIAREDVGLVSLGKQPGVDVTWYGRLWRVFRHLRPAIVHTRNLGTLEAQAVALAAGAAGRVHGEHGRDVWDLDGTNRKYRLLRRVLDPCVGQYIAVNTELQRWLIDVIGAQPHRVARIYNGVDAMQFRPRAADEPRSGRLGLAPGAGFVVGTVGRMAAVKDQITLARAFLHLLRSDLSLRDRIRLVLVGDGPLRAECLALLEAEGAASLCWMPGDRDDIPEILRSLDLFILPSIAEGTSNTILEAMASGLPVVASSVGGNPDLVVSDVTGTLVPARDPIRLATAIRHYLDDPLKGARHGARARQRVVSHFSLKTMMDAYEQVYDRVLQGGRVRSAERRAVTRAAV